MTLEEYARCDGLELASLIRKGEVLASEVAELALAGIAKVNPVINAVIETFPEQAAELEAKGAPAGPFGGVPFLVKDFPIYEGMLAEFGSELARGYRAPRTTVLGERLRAAGLVNLGRTTTSEFGLAATTENRINGPTGNPWDANLTTGGSSGGAAAITATGAVPVAQGGDAGGSIRGPAALCGLVGLKPTRGRVTGAPGDVAPLSGLATGFMITRTVRDCAALLDVCEGPEAGDGFEIARPARPYRDEADHPVAPLRIAYTDEAWSSTRMDASVRQAVEDSAVLCEELGHEVEKARPDFDYDEYLNAQKVIWYAYTYESVSALERLCGRRAAPTTLQSSTFAWYERGAGISASTFIKALDVYRDVTRRIGRFLTTYDLFLTPTCLVEPRPLGTYDPDEPDATAESSYSHLAPHETFTAVFNATGLPAISLPLARSASGLPIGMQFAGRFGAEPLLFRVAFQLEQARPWAERRPTVHVSPGSGPEREAVHDT